MKVKLVFILFFAFCISIFPQSRKIKDLENKRKKTLLEIDNTNKLLIETKKTSATLNNRIKLISSQLTARRELISILNQEVESINEEQLRLSQEIYILGNQLNIQKENYAKAVRSLVYKKQNHNQLIFILSGKSLHESLRRVQFLKDYTTWRNKEAIDIQNRKEKLSEKQSTLNKNKVDKVLRLNQRSLEEAKLQEEEKLYQQEIESTKEKEKDLKIILQQKQDQANKLNGQIEQLIAEEVAKQEQKAKRLAQEKARKEKEKKKKQQQSSQKTVRRETENRKNNKTESANEETSAIPISKENYKLSNNFSLNKGRLPMPVKGRYSIINKFGTNYHSKWKITTKNNGIDIKAQSGADALCIFEGEVSKIVAFPGFNNCIIVRHGGYYTFYGNIHQVYVKQGQKISTGQSLGKIYTDSDTGESQLHFQLWKGTTKLNPELWLKR